MPYNPLTTTPYQAGQAQFIYGRHGLPPESFSWSGKDLSDFFFGYEMEELDNRDIQLIAKGR